MRMKDGRVLTLDEWLAQRPPCTATSPAPKGDEREYYHPEAVKVGECSEGCCDDFRCPHCGVTWRVEYE